MSNYKQWSTEVRDDMYNRLMQDKKAGTLPAWVKLKGDCDMCGERFNTMPHAEDYGPTYEDYLKSLHVLCGRCHAMLHLRYRHGGYWAKHIHYVKAVRAGLTDRLAPIKNMGVLFAQSNHWLALPNTHQPNHDGEWWEALTTKRYTTQE